MNATEPKSNRNALDLARQVLSIEAKAVEALIGRLDDKFTSALQLILHCRGRVVVSGMGKSGHIARKIASTMASTGTPAFFVHPGEASHGDLGMITADDVLIALSNSGESGELLTIVPLINQHTAVQVPLTPTPTGPTSTPQPTNTTTPTSIPPTNTPSPTPVSVPGDVNGDGSVDLSDLSILLSNYGKSGMQRINGDLNNDTNVNLSDWSQLLANFGKSG